MHQVFDFTRLAVQQFEEGQYASVASELAAVRPSRRQAAYNTVFPKAGRRIDSFEYFRAIRRASGHNAYFHLPFCRSECAYCSYDKVSGPAAGMMDGYLDALEREIGRKGGVVPDFSPDIFYVGGGTPTLLSPRLMERFLLMLGRSFTLRGAREFTVETTPQRALGPEGRALLQVMAGHGVNRINVGVQSFDEVVTRKNGRVQSANDVIGCMSNLREAGFDTINLDLIYGLAGQDLAVWYEDLRMAVALQPDSITTFSLRVRPPSRLHAMVQRGEVRLPTERELLTMRLLAQQFLPLFGYHEDNSDYFVRSPEKRYLYQPFQPHNIDRNLIGFGPSAYSLAGDRQVFNITGITDYMTMIGEGRDPVGSAIKLNRGEFMCKRVAEGLRTTFDDRAFVREFGVSALVVLAGPLARLGELGLIVREGDELRLTPKGKVLHDYVADFINYRGMGGRDLAGR